MRSVESDCILICLNGEDVSGRDKDEFRLGINKPPNQPASSGRLTLMSLRVTHFMTLLNSF
jgi:hypothetical protein